MNAQSADRRTLILSHAFADIMVLLRCRQLVGLEKAIEALLSAWRELPFFRTSYLSKRGYHFETSGKATPMASEGYRMRNMPLQEFSIERAATEIVALISARSTTPTIGEIEAILMKMFRTAVADCPCVLEVRGVLAGLAESYRVASKLRPGAEFDAADAEIDRWRAQVKKLESRIPKLRL